MQIIPGKLYLVKLIRQKKLYGRTITRLLPQAVQTGEDGYKAIDYARLVPLLVEGIKEQQQMIASQKQSIDLLSSNDKNQQKQIDELKKMVEKLIKQ